MIHETQKYEYRFDTRTNGKTVAVKCRVKACNQMFNVCTFYDIDTERPTVRFTLDGATSVQVLQEVMDGFELYCRGYDLPYAKFKR